MKKLLSLLLALTSFVCFFLLPVGAEKPNLFPDGDIEDNPLAHGYSFDYGAKWYTAANPQDGNVHGGSHSLLFDCSGGTMQALLCNVSAANGFTVDTEYEISFWVKATDGFRGYEFVKLFYAHDGTFSQDYEIPVTPDSGNAYAFANNESGTEGVWEKVTGRFTLAAKHGESGQYATDGFRISFAFGTVVTPGKFYIDDITVTRAQDDAGESGSEPADKTSVSLRVDTNLERALVAIGYTYTLPDVKVTATDAQGNAVNLANAVTFTVYHGDVTHWDPVSGLTDVKNTAAARKIKIDRHGFYRVVYRVRNGDKIAETEFCLNVQDTVTDLQTNTRTEPISVHPGDAIDLSDVRIDATFSYTGQRTLKPGEYTVSPEKAPNELKTFQVTVKLVAKYDNTTITKTVTIPFQTVSADTPIDKTRLELKPDAYEVNVSYRLPYEIPDVTARAALSDGTEKDLHDTVTWSAYHYNADGWGAVATYQNVPLVKADGTGRIFTPTEHGYYQIIYRISLNGKSKTEVLAVNIMDTLTGITLDTSAVKTVYAVGEKLDLSGLVVHKILSYSGQSNLPAGGYKIDSGGFNGTKTGEYTVTVSHTAEFGGKKTASFTVSVVDPVVSVRMTSLPENLTCAFGTAPDSALFAATAVLQTAGETAVAGNELRIVGYDSCVVGKQTVSFYYRDVCAGTAEITVADTLYALEIDASSVKKAYRNNEKADLTGLQVTGIYASGARRLLGSDAYTVSPADFSGAEPGCYTLRVLAADPLTGEERFDTFRVEVTAAEASTSLLSRLLPVFALAAAAICAVAGIAIVRKKRAKSDR